MCKCIVQSKIHVSHMLPLLKPYLRNFFFKTSPFKTFSKAIDLKVCDEVSFKDSRQWLWVNVVLTNFLVCFFLVASDYPLQLHYQTIYIWCFIFFLHICRDTRRPWYQDLFLDSLGVYPICWLAQFILGHIWFKL